MNTKELYEEFKQYPMYYLGKPVSFIFVYILIPFVAGYVIPNLTGTTKNFTTKKQIETGLGITSNFQFSFNFEMFVLIFVLILIASMGLILYNYKNYQNTLKNIGKFYKIYSIFLCFYMGMEMFDKTIEKILNIELPNLKDRLFDIIVRMSLNIVVRIIISMIILTLTATMILSIIYFFSNSLSKIIEILKNKKSEEKSEINYKGLIASRKVKVNLLEKALEINNTILIDGKWGIGKTKFLEIFFETNKKNYHTIWIDVMLFNTRDKIKDEFMNQLKDIFKKERIIFNHIGDFSYFLNFLGNNFSNLMKGYFKSSSSFNSAKESLKNDFKCLKKEMVVIYDNLERIVENGVAIDKEWKEVISFIHDIAEFEHLKNIVVADYEKLTRNCDTDGKENVHEEYFDKFYDVRIEIQEAVDSSEVLDVIEDERDEILKIEEVILELNQELKEWISKIEEENEEFYDLYNQYKLSIKNPRNIVKIKNKYLLNLDLKEKDCFNNMGKYNEVLDKCLILASIFEIIHFDQLTNSKNISELFSRNNYNGYFLRVYSNSLKSIKVSIEKEYEYELTYNKIFERIFYLTKEEIDVATNKLENLTEESFKSFNLKKYIEYLDIYYRAIGTSEKLQKAYELIRKGIILEERKRLLEFLDNEIIWTLEDIYSSMEVGELYSFIQKSLEKDKKFLNYKESDIKSYIIKSFETEYKLLLKLKYTYTNKLDFDNDSYFKNIDYEKFKEKMEEITDKEELNEIKQMLIDLIQDKIQTKNDFLIRRINILFDRLLIIDGKEVSKISLENNLEKIKKLEKQYLFQKVQWKN